jgi:broad specificity phosphatase PhoE
LPAIPDRIFTIFLVRHAEKVTDAKGEDRDPPLNACGKSRAMALATQLRYVDLERVYSTSYLRTLDTAKPVAANHRLGIEAYDPASLGAFSTQLLEQGQNALVVGHSNTTAVLAGLLAGESGDEFDEDEYDRLYMVTVSGAQRQLNLLDQAFVCHQ